MIDEFDLDQDGEISEQEFIASVLHFLLPLFCDFDHFVAESWRMMFELVLGRRGSGRDRCSSTVL